MKVLMYGTHPYEKPYAEKWAQQTQTELRMVDEPLNDETVELAKDFDAITVLQTASMGSPAVYEKLASFGIKQISCRMVGVDMVDLDAAKANHLIVTNVASYSPRAIAEMGVAQAMYLLRRIGIFDARMNQNHDFSWNETLISNEIYNCTVGLIGAGHIGTATAQIYKALGARVIVNDIAYDPALEPFAEYVDRETIFKEADIISLHTPLLPSTRGMIGEKELKKMKKTAYLINMARGALIDTTALIKALKDGEIAGAGLDTLADETTFFGQTNVAEKDVPADYKELAAMPNVVITPHVAFFTQTAARNMVQIASNDAITIANGGRSRNEIRY